MNQTFSNNTSGILIPLTPMITPWTCMQIVLIVGEGTQYNVPMLILHYILHCRVHSSITLGEAEGTTWKYVMATCSNVSN